MWLPEIMLCPFPNLTMQSLSTVSSSRVDFMIQSSDDKFREDVFHCDGKDLVGRECAHSCKQF